MPKLEIHDNGKRINLKCEDFYLDFKIACEELFKMPEPVITKLSSSFLAIPDYENDKLVVKLGS